MPTGYSVNNLTDRFTREVRAVFARPESRQLLGDETTNAINDILAERAAAEGDNRLFLAYFWYPDHLGRLLDARMGSGTWSKHEKSIKHLAHAPYLTGIPSEIDANPVYSDEHRWAIDIWRERTHTAVTEEIRPLDSFESKMGAETYVAALLKFTVDDVIALRRTDEWAFFNKTLNQDHGNERDLRELTYAYYAHRLKVEQKCLNILGTTPSKGADESLIKASIVEAGKECSFWLVLEFLDFLFGAKLFGVLGLARSVMKRPDSAQRLLVDEHEISKARAQLEKDEAVAGKGRVESPLNVFPTAERDTWTHAPIVD